MSAQKSSSSQLFAEDNVALELTFRKLFTKLWPFLWKHKQRVLISVVLVLCFVFIGRILPFLFGHAVDEGIRKSRLEVIGWIAAAYFFIQTMRMFLAVAQNRYIQTLGNTVLYEIREKLLAHVQRLPNTYFDRNPSGRTVTRVTNDVGALGELFSQGFAAIFVNLIEMASIFLSLAFISLPMTGVILIILPALFFTCWHLSRSIRFQFGETKRKLASIYAYSAEALGGMKVIQVFNRTVEAQRFFESLSREYRILQIKTVKLFATLWPVMEGFKIFNLAVALLLGSWLHSSQDLSLGQLAAYLLLLQGFFAPLKVILERYNQLQNSLASADRVFHLFGEAREPQDGLPLPKTKLQGRIEFRNLSFKYADNGPDVLQNLNLVIAAGTSVALVGRTGSGKSTVVSLLQKLYRYDQGQILIDGLTLNDISSSTLRPKIGVVQQDGFVFSGSILTNITLDNPSVPLERARWAAEQAQCADILSRHVGGLDAKVEERGLNLSAGERQLLAFARVLAFDPDILILDEATANIDSLSERQIQAATEIVTRGRTSLIIAHRLSTILHCDQIVVMDHGKVAEVGTHNELMRINGIYARLHQSQFSKINTVNQEIQL